MFRKKSSEDPLVDNPLEPGQAPDPFYGTDFANLARKTVLFEEYEFNTKSDEYKQFMNHKNKMLFVYVIFVDLARQDQLPQIDEQELQNYISRQHHNSFVSLLPINNPQQANPSMIIK